MCFKNNGIKNKIQENLAISIAKTFKKEGYHVKTNFKYPGSSYNTTAKRYGKYTLDIFAYRGSNDIKVVEFENCADVLSRENENKWKYLISKQGLNLHIVVPYSCRKKAYLKSKFKNIPVEIHDYDNWREIFDLEFENFSK